LNSRALTKIQSIILIAIIIVTVVAAYFLLDKEEQSSETIKIGILTDIDGASGKHILQGAVLAAEHLNAEGGILEKQVKIIGEDTDFESGLDLTKINSALTRLLTVDDVDFIIGLAAGEMGFMIQDTIAEHKRIYIALGGIPEELTQRVIDNYDEYKYFFHLDPNSTVLDRQILDMLLHAREITGFNNVGYLLDDHPYTVTAPEYLEMLPELGFNLVYGSKFPPFNTFDFSSYFAAAETAGVEILVVLSIFDSGIPLLKEYYDRQAPMLVYGGYISKMSFMESWEQTGGKCTYSTLNIHGATIGYPVTSKTVAFHDSYVERWNMAPFSLGASSYDIIRFVLSEAIERARTTETEEVITALEEIAVETTAARKFAFASSHAALFLESMGNPDDYGAIATLFQWQEDGSLIPIYPKWLMEEAGVTYSFPDWAGPWDNIN
jgi:ABC-type branched-subunit amino acid transport system substrate-binding protein